MNETSSVNAKPAPGVTGADGKPILRLESVGFAYEGGHGRNGIHGISFEVRPGEAVLLCGESGCGKSTVTRLANGLIPHFYEGNLSGKVELAGKDTARMELWETAPYAGSVFQNPRTQFYNIDVLGEVAFTCENLNLPKNDILARVESALDDFCLQQVRNSSLFDLSGGQKQRVACASVSAATPPLFVLDEPSSNLDGRSIAALRDTLARWKQAGAAILIAEHRLYYLKDLIDTVYVLDEGRIREKHLGNAFFALTEADLAAKGLRTPSLERLRDAHAHLHHTETASTAENAAPSCTQAGSKAACTSAGSREASEGPGVREGRTIELHDFSFSYKRAKQIKRGIHVPYASFREGDIVALIGDNGAGKTTFADCISGIRKNDGRIVVGGQAYGKAKKRALAYVVMQDVNHQLFCENVFEEVSLGIPKTIGTETAEAQARQALSLLDLQDLENEHPRSLSGGQKQRVCVAAALTSKRPLVILDEPTSGLDYMHMKQTAQVVRQISREGRTVLVITHDPEFILSCCTCVCHFCDGGIAEQYRLDENGIQKMLDRFIEANR